MMMDALRAAFSDKLPNPGKLYVYGTAGFRGRYDESMHQLFVRVGAIAVLRSLDTAGKCTGVMVTASHNTEEDNGVKIVDMDGGMLVKKWESWSEAVANVSIDEFIRSVEAKLAELSSTNSLNAVVMIGQDTRSHSPVLVRCVQEGVRALGGRCLSLGEVITPVLHFCVDAFNRSGQCADAFSAGAAMDGYFGQLLQGYTDLLATAAGHDQRTLPLVLDASFGVGSIIVSDFLSYADRHSGLRGWAVEVRNAAGQGSVNAGCGAEHAQKLQQPPCGVDVVADAGKLLCSFDGDGDRIVFHAFPLKGAAATAAVPWILLDGDRITVLLATFLQKELEAAGIASLLSVGVVQTAYANGASTACLRGLPSPVPVVFAKTGVKYLHHAAKALDVGVYFEANGHGTVSFSETAKDLIRRGYQGNGGDGDHTARIAFQRLQACLKVINQTVGDALSDMLVTIAVLKLYDWTYEDWNAMYTELSSRQVKVSVPDKNKLKCSDDEMRLVSPESLQAALDNAMAGVPQGRCFIRPSGTEDVVRIYAEAATAEGVEQLVAASRGILDDFYAANSV